MKLATTASVVMSFALVLLPGACGKAPRVAQADPQLVAQFVGFLEGVVKASEHDLGDCTQMAADVGALAATNKSVLEAARASAREHRELSADANHRIKLALRKLQGVVKTCKDDQAVHDAFAPLLKS